MFDIKLNDNNEVLLYGRLDAVSIPTAREVLDTLTESCQLDFGDLEYIASAGLGLLVETQRRLHDQGQALTLVNMNQHLWDVFDLAGFSYIFDMEKASS